MAKLGVIHYNFPRFSLEEFLDFAARTGFEYVELQLPDVWPAGESDPESRAASVLREVASRGLKVSALAAHNDFVQLEADAVRRQVDRMRRICGLARGLNCDVVRSEGGQPKETVPPEKWAEAMYGCFSHCVDFLDELGVSLAIDNHGLATNDGDLLHALLRRLNHRRVGTNLDTMNYRWYGHDVPACNRFYEMMAPFALHIHLKDGTGSRQDYRGAALGEGEIDLAHALACLKKAGYAGVYCAEYEGPEREAGTGYARCYKWMKANIV